MSNLEDSENISPSRIQRMDGGISGVRNKKFIIGELNKKINRLTE